MKNASKKRKKKKQLNKPILQITYIFAGLFIVLIFYIGKFIVVDSQDIITNPYNKRQDMFAESVIRGDIATSDGKIIATSKVSDKGEVKRVYPFDRLYAHAVGFAARGKSGLESVANYNLLTSNANAFERMFNTLTEKKNTGDTVVTTIDSRLQKAAYDALGNRKGAVIVMEPSSGKILAMVSKPDFNPNSIDSDWSSIIAEDSKNSSVLINRVTQGKYPPGSTFKILTALQYMREHPDYKNYSYVCKGSGSFFGTSIKCYNNSVHGKENLSESFAHSCNTSFANMALDMNMDAFNKLCNQFLFNQDLPTRLLYNKSSFTLDNKAPKGLIPQTVIGQGKTLVTPLHMAMITSTVANGGVMMEPYYIDHIENYDGALVKKYGSKSYKSIITADESAALTKLMEGVVKSGTGTGLASLGHSIAGKTGSAEFQEGQAAHAWFTGFAPSQNPEIAVCVIVENVGTGSTYAVPVAKKIFQTYFSISAE